ncbi:hypothetical protein CEXT_651241 [Caerostris extrusa]|uniref:Uncharacterized protein n=1 Tax=Caerostris extrusa TaxID=172846 RepID=A0AAV4TAR0_CAEEX|nr:hypothetical protein CEXT_651241 [Caerostris extrusa]
MRNHRAELSLDAGMMDQRSLIGRKVSITAKQCMRNEKRGVATGHVSHYLRDVILYLCLNGWHLRQGGRHHQEAEDSVVVMIEMSQCVNRITTMKTSIHKRVIFSQKRYQRHKS